MRTRGEICGGQGLECVNVLKIIFECVIGFNFVFSLGMFVLSRVSSFDQSRVLLFAPRSLALPPSATTGFNVSSTAVGPEEEEGRNIHSAEEEEGEVLLPVMKLKTKPRRAFYKGH